MVFFSNRMFFFSLAVPQRSTGKDKLSYTTPYLFCPPPSIPHAPAAKCLNIETNGNRKRQQTRYDCLKADLSVSLEETRGGADAVAFGARPGKNGNGNAGGGGDRPWGSGVGPRTFTDMIAAASSAGAGGGDGAGGGEGDGNFLWGCTSAKEEREQLVSFVSLGCFDPSARLQVLLLFEIETAYCLSGLCSAVYALASIA